MDLKGFALGVLLALASLPAWAAAPVVRVVGPAPVADDVAARLAAHADQVTVTREGEARLVIAVGARAFQDAVAGADDTPVVGVALTRRSYLQVQAGSHRHTALFWEPDPVLQLRLAKVLLPGARRVGLVIGEADDARLAAIRREASRLRLEPVIGVLGAGDSLSRRLNAVLAGSDFLLGLDDPAVFAPEHAKTVLLTSYRHAKPVIGPTASFVEAGSIASLAAGVPAMVDALVAWLPDLLDGGALPPPRYADRYPVVTNPQVGRSLQLSLPPVQRLEALLYGDGDRP